MKPFSSDRMHGCHLERLFTTAALLILTVATFGCTAGDTATPPAASPSAAQAATDAPPPAEGACALVTPAEAEALLQDTVRRPRPETARTGSVQRSACFYRSPKGTIEIILNEFDTPAAADERYIALRKLYPGSDTRDVSGIGDAAFWTRRQLVVKRGDVHLHIEVEFEDTRKLKSFDDAAGVDGLIEVERRLAQTALGRISATPQS